MTRKGATPVGTDAATTVSAPLAGLMLKTVTSLESAFGTYAKRPDGSIVTDCGATPVANGEPDTDVNAPVAASIANTDTLFDPWLAVKANRFAGSTWTPRGSAPVRT